MGRSKIAISLDQRLLHRIDSLVKKERFPNRSQAIQEAVEEKLVRMGKSRLAQECAKLGETWGHRTSFFLPRWNKIEIYRDLSQWQHFPLMLNKALYYHEANECFAQTNPITKKSTAIMCCNLHKRLIALFLILIQNGVDA